MTRLVYWLSDEQMQIARQFSRGDGQLRLELEIFEEEWERYSESPVVCEKGIATWPTADEWLADKQKEGCTIVWMNRFRLHSRSVELLEMSQEYPDKPQVAASLRAKSIALKRKARSDENLAHTSGVSG